MLSGARIGSRKAGRVVAIEAPPADEMPAGVPDLKPERPAMPRPPYGAGTPEAREAARRGGAARAGTVGAADTLGLTGAGSEPYRRRADNFRRAQVCYLERHVGGGQLAPDIRALVKLGALALAAAERAYDKGDDVNGRAAALEARQTFATAREYAAREGQHRRKTKPQTEGSVAQLKRRLGIGEDG